MNVTLSIDKPWGHNLQMPHRCQLIWEGEDNKPATEKISFHLTNRSFQNPLSFFIVTGKETVFLPSPFSTPPKPNEVFYPSGKKRMEKVARQQEKVARQQVSRISEENVHSPVGASQWQEPTARSAPVRQQDPTLDITETRSPCVQQPSLTSCRAQPHFPLPSKTINTAQSGPKYPGN